MGEVCARSALRGERTPDALGLSVSPMWPIATKRARLLVAAIWLAVCSAGKREGLHQQHIVVPVFKLATNLEDGDVGDAQPSGRHQYHTEIVKKIFSGDLATEKDAVSIPCNCSGQSFAGRGNYCGRWGRNYAWCYTTPACPSAWSEYQSAAPMYVYRCPDRFHEPVNNTALVTMSKIASIVAVKTFTLEPGHMHCKNRITAFHHTKESKLCLECEEGYYLLIDGAVMSDRPKDEPYARAVGTCQPIQTYALWSHALKWSDSGREYDAKCMQFYHSRGGVSRTKSGRLEVTRQHAKRKRRRRRWTKARKKRWKKMSAQLRRQYRARARRAKMDKIKLGYVCAAAPIMPGFFLYNRKRYLKARYVEQSSARFVACHNNKHSAYSLKCDQRKQQGPCTEVMVCALKRPKSRCDIVIGNPEGIEGPPYQYKDKVALDKWVTKAKIQANKYIINYKKGQVRKLRQRIQKMKQRLQKMSKRQRKRYRRWKRRMRRLRNRRKRRKLNFDKYIPKAPYKCSKMINSEMLAMY